MFTNQMLLLLTAVSIGFAAEAAPATKPPFPNKLVLTQGSRQLFLAVPNQSCSNGYQETRTSGMRRFRLLNCYANGSYVQFPEGADITSNWVYPAACLVMPAPITRPGVCPAGQQGNWTQTATYSAAQPQVPPDGCWVLGPYQPASAPAGVCTAPPAPVTRTQDCAATNPGTTGTWTQTHDWVWDGNAWQPAAWVPTAAPAGACSSSQPPFQWQAPRPSSTFPVVAKPAKDGSYVSPYGTTVTRVTDSQADAGVAWVANWYNRFEAVNSNGTKLLAFQPNGFWDVFNAQTNAFMVRLSGPAGDAEIQWDATDPNSLYYLPINGGTVLKKMDVTQNTSANYYDFTAAVHALWPDANRCWTKSEGSPSKDGRYWGLMCETDSFVTRGFVKLDLTSKAVAWSKTNTGARPDNVTISPSGKWFIVSGLAPLGTTAYATDGSGATCLIHQTVEHADVGVLSNGHDVAVLPNFTTGLMIAVDIDTCSHLEVHWPTQISIYNNPWLDNIPAHSCANCGVHTSAKAFAKPGWVLLGFYGGTPIAGVTPPSNVIALNVETGAFYGVAASYAAHGGYWDEAHFFVDRTFSHAWGTENWNHPGTDPNYTIDIVRIDIPQLP